jgi:hypothetical protein
MESFKQLFIFIEGPYDERFFEKQIKPLFLETYSNVKLIKYASSEKKFIVGLIKTLKHQPSSAYIFVSDFDARGDNHYCVTQKKEKVREKFSNVIDNNCIVVVKEEIESWYLAGITNANLERFKIKSFLNTEQIDKESFIDLLPKEYTSKTDFLIESLKEFSLETGIDFNNSLKYFVAKYKLLK